MTILQCTRLYYIHVDVRICEVFIIKPFDAHCCHMGTAEPYCVRQGSAVICNFFVPGFQKLQMAATSSATEPTK